MDFYTFSIPKLLCAVQFPANETRSSHIFPVLNKISLLIEIKILSKSLGNPFNCYDFFVCQWDSSKTFFWLVLFGTFYNLQLVK